jgi:hypothetical protein
VDVTQGLGVGQEAEVVVDDLADQVAALMANS